MILTLADTCSRATMMAGGRNDWALSEASFYANMALQEVATRVRHTPLEALAYSSTTSGENRIGLPSDFYAPLAMSNLSTWGVVGGRQLRWVDAAWMDSQTTQSGEPEAIAWYGNWLELWPSPDSSYSVGFRYLGRQRTLVASTDTPQLREDWHPGWLYKTVSLLEASRSNPAGEAIAENRYLRYMTSTENDQALRQKTRTGMTMRYLRNED